MRDFTCFNQECQKVFSKHPSMVKNHDRACCSVYCRDRVRKKKISDPVERNRFYYLRNVYGITQQQYLDLLVAQGGKCGNSACSATEPGMGKNNWCIDHDHSCCPGLKSCGKCIRGILCHKCNVSLGNLDDSADKLMGLINYLKVKTL